MRTGIAILKNGVVPISCCKRRHQRLKDVVSQQTPVTLHWPIEIALSTARRQTLWRPSLKSSVNLDSSENMAGGHWCTVHLDVALSSLFFYVDDELWEGEQHTGYELVYSGSAACSSLFE